MNKVTKKLLLEIMSYANLRKIAKSDIYIRKAQEKLGDINFYVRSSDLLSWIDPRDHFSFSNLEKYEIYEEFMTEETITEITEQFSLLFKYIPELNEIFVFENKAIKFNTSLNNTDIKEIYDFVKTNYIINPLRVSRYIRPIKE